MRYIIEPYGIQGRTLRTEDWVKVSCKSYRRGRAFPVLRKHVCNDGRTMSSKSFSTFPRASRYYWIGACSRFYLRSCDYFATFFSLFSFCFFSSSLGFSYRVTMTLTIENSTGYRASIMRRIKWTEYFRRSSSTQLIGYTQSTRLYLFVK